MEIKGIDIKEIPDLKNPFFIAGFDGWGNALNVSTGTVDFLINRLVARPMADLNPDLFYRYDATRPMVRIESGDLKTYRPPKGIFYYAKTEGAARDLVLLKADEPVLGWHGLVTEMYELLLSLGVDTVISIGSMYDNVLHKERKISSIISGETLRSSLEQKGVDPISYTGPSTIHSTIHWEGKKRKMTCASLWCHCPYYVQGTTHFGLMAELGKVLAFLGGFEVNTKSLDENWDRLMKEIDDLVQKNDELSAIVRELEKSRGKPASPILRRPIDPNEKVINLKDFLEPK